MRACSVAGILGIVASLAALTAAVPGPAAVDRFEKRVRPLLAARCSQCHGSEKSKGGLRLDTAAAVNAGGDSGSVVTPGNPGKSLLIDAVGYAPELKMPPKGKRSDAEISARPTIIPTRESSSRRNYVSYSVENKVHVHDLHATILYLLGLDHTKLTYRYAGRDFRLTDVYGEVVRDIIG